MKHKKISEQSWYPYAVAICLGVLLYVMLEHMSNIWGAVSKFSGYFSPVLLGCVLAYLINFFFNICFGFLAFVIKYLWGANMMKNCIVGFLSGAIIPLSFLPETLGRIFMILPFASLNYTPVMIYMGVYQGTELLYYLGLQVFWALFFFGLSKLLWVVSVRRLSVQGG